MNSSAGWAMLSLLSGVMNPGLVASQQDYSAPILAGISNHGQNPGQPYVTAGDRVYLIGTQDGNFPDLGTHVPGEMGGLWLHPIKLLDGFWATITDVAISHETALSQSVELITHPHGSRFRYAPVLDGLEVERFQFSPDGREGLIVQYRIKNTANRRRQLHLLLSVKTDLSPVWFSDRLGIRDAPDSVTWNGTRQLFIANDRDHPWFSVWGAADSNRVQPIADPSPVSTRGMGATAASRYSLSVDPHGTSTLTIVIAGSATSKDSALSTYRYLARNHARLLEAKKEHYASILESARVTIPDRRWQEVYNWVRVNAEWLIRDIPGIGRGLGGGLMEYPWWFGTETYSLQALMATGDFDLPKQTLRLLRDQSRRTNGNGRILHELTTNGAVSNPGNTQETAQFILTAGQLFEWTGDMEFAKEMYPAMKQGLDWLMIDMDRNRNLFPEGYGIMEVSGLNAELIDVAVYTHQALRATARIASVLKEPREAEQYRELASRLEARINDRFWAEDEESYADFYGTRAQAVSAAKGAIRQIRLKGEDSLTRRDRSLIEYYERLERKLGAMPDRPRGWITNKNWVIATPMETGIAPRARALRLLDKIREENVGAYGPFLSAVERQAMMTISTGVQAVSEANYGRTDRAVWYVDKILQTFNRTTPGSISEMMPDYGCFTIAWTSYGIVVPLIQHVFGIHPDAMNKTVVFEPHVPTGWANMSIEDLPIGTTVVSFSRAKTDRGVEYSIEADDEGWTFVLRGKEFPGARLYVNGKPAPFISAGIRMSGTKNHVLVAP
jgi:glycogen debranching enzyme